MKTSLTIVALLLLLNRASAQDTTAAMDDDKIITYMNQAWAFALKHDSLRYVQSAIDSSWRWLDAHPNSWARPSLFLMMLKTQTDASTDTAKIFPLIDSVLAHDSMAGTKLDIGKMLIENKIDLAKGAHLVDLALPGLTVDHHKYLAHLLLAEAEAGLGKSALAQTDFLASIAVEPKRGEGRYAYLAFLKATEQTKAYNAESKEVRDLETEDALTYLQHAEESDYIGKSLGGVTAYDMENTGVSLSSLVHEPTVIVYFNFWCGACQMELPAIAPLIGEFNGATLLFVDANDTRGELKDIYFKKKKYKFLAKQKLVFDDSAQVYHALNGQTGVPRTLVLDKAGVIRLDMLGYTKQTPAILRKELRALLGI